MNIIERIKLLLGYPPKPQPHQVNEQFTTMRLDRDCLPVALSNATKRSYEECYLAVGHKDLPFFLESPFLSNPINAVRAIKKLGFDCDDTVTISSLRSHPEWAGKVLILTHNPKSFVSAIWQQHWVVWDGEENGLHKIIWGTGQKHRYLSFESLNSIFSAGWPDCAILVK